MERAMDQDGWSRATEKAGETELVVLRRGPDSDETVVHGLRGETIVIGNNADVVKSLLAVWDGEKKPTLAENNDFTAIMRRCGSEAEEKPQISFYVDPLEIVRRVAGGEITGQTFLALLPALGLDGIQGLGGSVTFSTEQYDSLVHFHLLLSNPRKGVLEMLALRQGDLTPEPWVPKDVVSYATLHWDFPATYNALNTLYDAIRGPGRLEEDVKASLSEPLGVDFRKEILDAMDGRVSLAGWMVKPARLNSRANLLGVKLKDAKAFQPTFERLLARIGPQVKKESLGSVVYYSFAPPQRPDNPQRPERPLIRRPEPAIALVGDYVLLTDSTDLLRRAVAVQGDESEQLAGELEFRLITSRVRVLPGGENIGMLTFNRPEEGMRLVYDLATSDTTRQRLASQAENNQFFRALNDALKDNPLPPFSVLARYLAPGGGLLTNDETGFHYTSFTLKRK
jgi:hypothetical protein